ncbi:MAG: YkgJ family cysteine cluster protein [Clostridiales bacterium]
MIEPNKIKKAFDKVEEENWILRAFLKDIDDVDELDKLVNSMHKEFFDNYDCSKCGNCCKMIVSYFDESEIKVASENLKISVDDFKKIYLKKTTDGYIMNKKPCLFWEDSKCTIYKIRPENCREYPYTDKEEIWSRLINLVENSSVCPIVFEIFERLKKYYGTEFQKYKKEYKKIWGDF